MPEVKKMTLATVKGGAPEELFQRELAKVLENFRDLNTSARGKRQIKLTFTFVGREDKHGGRHEMAVAVDAEAKLQPVLGASTYAFVGRENGEFGVYTADVQQEDLGLVDKTTGEVTNIADRIKSGPATH